MELYRSTLAAAENSSINIISIGFLTNLADLLHSQPDTHSPLPGPDLISSKVRELVVMGGQYPSGWEYNFGGADPSSAAYVLEHWPRDVPVTFSGLELGADIWSGHTMRATAPYDSPVRAAYEWYMGRCNTVQRSWDPVTVLYGVLGMHGFGRLDVEALFEFASAGGHNRVNATDGSNAWVDDPTVRNQHWLKLAAGVSNETVARLLNGLYAQDPAARECFGSPELAINPLGTRK